MPSSTSIFRPLLRRSRNCPECRILNVLSREVIQKRWITRNHLRKIKVSEEDWERRKADIESGRIKSVLKVLEDRGLVNQVVGNRDELERLLVEKRVGAYCGIDPTAASLHVGHMVPYMALGWMYIHGYTSNFLLGGFTATIGDPTDRLTARAAQKRAEQKHNMLAMFDQLKRLATSIEKYAERRGYQREWSWRRAVLNNAQWWDKLTVKEYMRALGVFMRVGPMLGRDSVKNRLEKGDGMSYAEFSYPLIQGWDWWEQYKTGTQIQIGGADQYGNILAGAEAVKHIRDQDNEYQQRLHQEDEGINRDPMGFTVPLLTTSSGEKFGKSAGNAVWIDRQLTSSFDLYQFFLRSADADVEKYLRLLTFLPLPDIATLMAQHKQDESQRLAQHKLAKEFVELVHGLQAAEEAERQHKAAFSDTLTIADIQSQKQDVGADGRPADIHPSLNKHAAPQDMNSTYNLNVTLPRSLIYQQPLSRILWSAGLAGSRSEGQRLINNGGAYLGGRRGKGGATDADSDQVNYVPATDSKWSFVEQFVIEDNLLVLRTGKWKKKFVHIVPDEEYAASGLSCPGWEEAQNPQLTDADLAGEEAYRQQASERKAKSEQRRLRREAAMNNGSG